MFSLFRFAFTFGTKWETIKEIVMEQGERERKKKRRAGLITRERFGCDGANEKNHKYVHRGSCALSMHWIHRCCDRDKYSMRQTSCFPLSDCLFASHMFFWWAIISGDLWRFIYGQHSANTRTSVQSADFNKKKTSAPTDCLLR